MFGGFGKYKKMEELEMQSKEEIEAEKNLYNKKKKKG